MRLLDVLTALLFYSFLPALVRGVHNMTVDDTDPSIQYSAGWSLDAISNTTINNTYHVTDFKTAGWTFNFTGTGVYIMSPLWPQKFGGIVSLDGSSLGGVWMQDFTHNASTASEKTVVVWGTDGLKNGPHTLSMSTSPNDWDYMSLDAIVYTTLDSNDTPTNSPTITSTSNSAPFPTITTQHQTSSVKKNVPIVMEALFGVLALILIPLGSYMAWRRIQRRRRGTHPNGRPSPSVEIDPENPRYRISPFPSLYAQQSQILPPSYEESSSTSPHPVLSTFKSTSNREAAKVSSAYGDCRELSSSAVTLGADSTGSSRLNVKITGESAEEVSEEATTQDTFLPSLPKQPTHLPLLQSKNAGTPILQTMVIGNSQLTAPTSSHLSRAKTWSAGA